MTGLMFAVVCCLVGSGAPSESNAPIYWDDGQSVTAIEGKDFQRETFQKLIYWNDGSSQKTGKGEKMTYIVTGWLLLNLAIIILAWCRYR